VTGRAGQVEVRWAHPTLDGAHLLVGDEEGRARTHMRETGRARFTTGVALTRAIAADWLGLSPREVVIDRTNPDTGEPTGAPRIDGIHVSVTHSGDWVGVAVALEPVGLDCEQVDTSHDVERLIRRTLSEPERADLPAAGAGDDARLRAFLRLWTRKEALAKARGTGMIGNFREIDAFDPGLRDLELDDGHVAALYAPGLELVSSGL
jgi:4'-phosphopantetheinyl transferase